MLWAAIRAARALLRAGGAEGGCSVSAHLRLFRRFCWSGWSTAGDELSRKLDGAVSASACATVVVDCSGAWGAQQHATLSRPVWLMLCQRLLHAATAAALLLT